MLSVESIHSFKLDHVRFNKTGLEIEYDLINTILMDLYYIRTFIHSKVENVYNNANACSLILHEKK